MTKESYSRANPTGSTGRSFAVDSYLRGDGRGHYIDGFPKRTVDTRDHLLEKVSVTEQGIAVCANDTWITKLCAFFIDTDGKASKIPFDLYERQDNDALLLPIPYDTRVGLFIADNATGQTTGATLRQGEYPGLPLAAETVKSARGEEIFGLRAEMVAPMEGIQDTNANRWAQEIGLADLGFNPERTRELLGLHFEEGGEITTIPLPLRNVPEDDILQILTFKDEDSTRVAIKSAFEIKLTHVIQ